MGNVEEQLKALSVKFNFPFIAFAEEGRREIERSSTFGPLVECRVAGHRVGARLLFVCVRCPRKCDVCVRCVLQTCGEGPFRCPLCKRGYSRMEREMLKLHARGLKEPHLT